MTKLKSKTPGDSQSYLAEIVGEESLFGERMSAGKLLQMMDLVAASAAVRHAESPLVTLAFDRIELLNFIFHMDYVRYDAYVIKVGRTSMVVKVDGFAKSPTEMVLQPVHSGVITLVAIDENRRPNPNIPQLVYRTNEDRQKKRVADQRADVLAKKQGQNKRIDELKKIPKSRLIDNYSRKQLFTPSQTTLSIRKTFLPRHANTLGAVFGGDTIEMMEELALATARQFTGNFKMVTIAMEDVLFLKPLLVDSLVEMDSVVTFVARSTLSVEITVRSIDFFNPLKTHITNNGTFTILNYDRSGRTKEITNGLDLSKAGLLAKKKYLKELKKYQQVKRA